MNDITKIIMDLINNGLFPIACCGGLLYVLVKIYTTNREDLQKLHDQHAKETKSFTDALNKNTNILTVLCERLKGGDNDDDE